MSLPRNEKKRQECRFPDGGDKGSRTPDLLNAIETLYQLSYIPVVKTADSIPNPRVGCKRDFDEFWIADASTNHAMATKSSMLRSKDALVLAGIADG